MTFNMRKVKFVMVVKPGTTFSSLFVKTANVNAKSTTKVTNSNFPTKNTTSATTNTVLENSTRTKSSTTKRRLSGDREENPSSKIHLVNSFDFLQDEMDSESLKKQSPSDVDPIKPTTSTDSVQSSTLVPVVASEQAGIALSACHVEQAGNSDFTCPLEQVEIS